MPDRVTNIEVRNNVYAVTFSANGEYLLSGQFGDVGLWTVEDGKQIATFKVKGAAVHCLAVSTDGGRIAAGTGEGDVFVWDAGTRKQVCSYKEDYSSSRTIHAVDFSPDSTRLVTASSNCVASVWDIATRERVLLLPHNREVIAAKYSPQGDRIVIATQDHVRVYDYINRRFLVDIRVKVTSSFNNGLLWFSDHLFVISNGRIKQFEASTGSTVSEWPAPGTNEFSCISLPNHGRFIAYSTGRTVMFWDALTNMWFTPIHHPQEIRSMSLSPDDRYLAIGGKEGKVIIETLSHMETLSTREREQQDKQLWKSGRHGDNSPDAALVGSAHSATAPSSTRKQGQRDKQSWKSGRHDDNLPDAALEKSRKPPSLPRVAVSIPLSRPHPTSSTVTDCAIEINVQSDVYAVIFSSDGKYLVTSQHDIQVWQVEDGKQMARMKCRSAVHCLAMSADGRQIAAGTEEGGIFIWDMETYKQVFSYNGDRSPIHGVDFSPDSTRLVTASSSFNASVWDIATREQVLLLPHNRAVIAAKYSSQGDRIVIATQDRVRVYDSINCRFLTDVGVTVTSLTNNGILWSDNHLLVLSDEKIKRFEASTGAMVSEWPVRDINQSSCISLPKHGKFMAYSTNSTVTLWDTLTQNRISVIQRPHTVRSIAFSPDDRYLAIGGGGRKVIIESLIIMDASAREQGRQEKQPLTSGRHNHSPPVSTQVRSGQSHPTRHTPDPRQRSFKELVHLGDEAADAQQHDEAITHYTTALSLNPPSPQLILIKRSRVFLTTGAWKQALRDADEAVRLDPSSPWGYEMKQAASHKARKYDDAIDAFETMLLKMAESSDPEVQQHGDQYISSSTTQATIRKIVQRTIRHSPRVLINTTTGRLYTKADQASAFESLPVFKELVSSMKTRIDYVRIKREVRQYFRYVMLSHRWEDNEPLFERVTRIAVYDLDKSPTHDKLQTFCGIVRDAGFRWAWSDTCCINKLDHFELQEALVAMFRWYRGSALVIVFLRGVRSTSQLGALVKSIWNTRAWTLQEYVAAKVVHFYTEDWTLYLNLELLNHKESSIVISEMERATGVPAEQLMSLRPGLTNIREKLRLASTRHTTVVEDAAYSLLGIFSVAGLPAIYGEGEGSLGRLLAHVLAGSGDVSILAWTGESGSFNSCLPAQITVFSGPATSHLPTLIPEAEMKTTITTASHAASFDLDVALNLYDRISELPSPWFAASRMKLPCIAFQLPPLTPYRTRSGRIYRADTPAFGMVEITTRQDLSRIKTLYIVHSWLDSLMEQEDAHGDAFVEDVPPPSPVTDDEEVTDDFDDDALPVPETEVHSHAFPEDRVPIDRETRARRLVARLRQSFGALLLTPAASGRRVTDYKRVAADALITVRFQEDFPLADILDNVRTLDVL